MQFAYYVSLVFIFNTAYSQNKIYVSEQGNNSNNGSIDKPYKTLQKAFENLSDNTIIYIRNGRYEIDSSIKLINKNNIKILAYNKENVEITGAKLIPTSFVNKIDVNNHDNRINKSLANNIYSIELSTLNIKNYGMINKDGFGSTRKPSYISLISDNKPKVLARYPNIEKLKITESIKKGSQNSDKIKDTNAEFKYEGIKRNWSEKNKIWIGGIFAVGWAYDNIPVKNINYEQNLVFCDSYTSYGIYDSNDISNGNVKSAKEIRGFFFYNILEELDTQDEWFLDEKINRLYLYKETDIKNEKIELTILEEPLLNIQNCSDIEINNIKFGATRGEHIKANKISNLIIQECSFINSGLQGVIGNNINACKITNSTFENIGAEAIRIDGGDRVNLKSSFNIISNCDFNNFALRYKSYAPALNISGVGCIITHCNIINSTGQAIIFSGNDHIIANNFISNVCKDFNDIGAIYTGRDPSSTGTIIKENNFSNINNNRSMVSCIYFDDGSGGMKVENNIFTNCVTYDKAILGVLHVNGGGNNLYLNNVFNNCKVAITSANWSDEKWAKTFFKDKSHLDLLTKKVDIRSNLYVNKYPYLKSFFDSTSIRPRINIIKNTVIYGRSTIKKGDNIIVTNYLQKDNTYSNDELDKNLRKLNVKWAEWKPPISQKGNK